MPKTINSNLLNISKTALILQKEKPFLKDVLKFYKGIFSLQCESEALINNKPIHLDKEVLANKIEHGFPLVSKQEFRIDFQVCENLFKKICNLCLKSEIKAGITAEALLDSLNNNYNFFKTISQNYLKGDSYSEDLFLENKNIDPKVFEFIVYNSLKPAIVKSSKQLSSYLKDDSHTEPGLCPVCGGLPAVSLLSEDNGSRSLVCSFCWHKWETKRIFCSFCANNNSDTLNYMHVEDEKGIRADICEECRKYIKTIDLREYRKGIYLPLELIAALPIDIKMIEQGYDSGIWGQQIY